MTPMELIPLLDKGMVEELRMYYNGHHSVVDIRNIPCSMPDYQIAKMWNSENGKGISVLLADNMAEDPDDNKCVLTQFGKCSYNETGCSDCYIKERIRKAIGGK